MDEHAPTNTEFKYRVDPEDRQTSGVPARLAGGYVPLGRERRMSCAIDGPPASDSLLVRPIGRGHVDLNHWYDTGRITGAMHDLAFADYHRLQIEHWCHLRARDLMGEDSQKRALDFGVLERRGWQDDRYKTAGVAHGEDYQIDLCAEISLVHEERYDVILCTEVLEHVADPFMAMDAVRNMLVPGGTVLLTSPFLWPDHATHEYPDYWRFTEGGWRLLCKRAGLAVVELKPIKWSMDGATVYNLLRRIEGWGFATSVEGQTGYLCEAKR